MELPESTSAPTETFDGVCRRLHPRLVAALAVHCGDRALAEDLAQEALARACRDWPKVSRSVSPDAWVFRTAFNLSTSWFRRVRTARRSEPMLRAVGTESDPSDRLAIRQAVASLPPRQRAAIVLRYLVDLSIADTAEVMRCAEGTVRALTSQALASLRAQLGPTFDLEEHDG